METDETIFDIIMPWVAEQKKELASSAKKKKTESASAAKKSVHKQSSLGSFFQVKSSKSTPGGKKSAPSQQPEAVTPPPMSDIFNEEEQIAMLSKVHKVAKVSEFNWTYKDEARKHLVHAKDLQCILINPKWADHGKEIYGGQTP